MLIEMGRHPQGLMIATKWVEAEPDVSEAWFFKSVCEMMLLSAKNALESAEKADNLAPNTPKYMAQKARCLVGVGATMKGLRLARKLVKQEDRNAHLLDAVANTISNAGEHEEAIPVFEKAISLNPNIPQYYSNYGTVLHFCRRTDEAEAAHRKSIELSPENFRAYWLLGGLRKATPEHNFVDWFDKVLKAQNDKLQARTTLNFALAKQHEDLEEYDDAFHHLADGSKAVLEHSPYQEEATLAPFHRFKEAFSPALVASRPAGHKSDEAIFIVGMPRSGTTLVERIVSAHDDVFAAGELHNFNHLLNSRFEKLPKNHKGMQDPADLVDIDFEALGAEYIEGTRPRTGHTPRFIDKYPFNFQFVGAIGLALPHSKIINLMRNPMDTCFGNYKLMFMPGSALYSYDQETLGRFYVEYRKLMEHWHEILPGRILDVHYEALVANPEDESKRIMDFLDLDWKPELLEFYKSNEAVATASTSQVREPVNAASINKWKKFERHLGPLKSLIVSAGYPVED